MIAPQRRIGVILLVVCSMVAAVLTAPVADAAALDSCIGIVAVHEDRGSSMLLRDVHRVAAITVFGGIPDEEEKTDAEDCPFCEGREDRTPPETWADRPGDGGPDTPGWRVRSVPNLYPALAQTWDDEGPTAAEGGSEPGEGFADWAVRAEEILLRGEKSLAPVGASK